MTAAFEARARLLSRLGLLASWEVILVCMLAITVALASVASGSFVSPTNLSSILSNLDEKALMILPMTLLLVAGEVDLSIASVAGLASVVMGWLFAHGVPLPAAIVVALAAGTLCGLVNGLLVARLGLPSLVVTLGTLALFRGLSSVILEGQAVAGFPVWFTDLGYGHIPGTLIPTPIALVAVLAVGFAFTLHLTPVGRILYAIGTSAESVRFSGIRVTRIRTGLFVASGVIAALAGVVYAARLASTRADAAIGFELDVITAALLGGVSIFGGRGTIVGALLGLILLGCVRGAMALLDISAEIQLVAVGALLIASVLVANAADRVRARSQS